MTNVAKEIPSFLGQTPDGGDNTHSCWPTDNGDFVVTGEERSGGGIKVYRITDNGGSLTLERTDSFALGGSTHNQVVVGYRVYNSWYSAGLQVFDIDPNTGLLEFVASHDTSSAWGVYPFLGPSKVLVSDIDDGLYVLSVDPPTPATLTSVEVTEGVILDGDVTDLLFSDDSYLHTRSGFGKTFVDLHNMEMVVSAVTAETTPTSIDLSIYRSSRRLTRPAELRRSDC